MNADGHFGKWVTDNHDLPAYEYTCDQYNDPLAKTPTTYGTSIDHFHQIGNDRISATVHNGGYVQVIESSRGVQWLTYRNDNPKKLKVGGGIGIIEIGNSKRYFSDLYTPEVSKINLDYRRIFGMGYFQKIIKGMGLDYKHSICSPLSDDPVLISEIEIHNLSNEELNFKVINFWDVYLHHLTKSLIVTSKNRRIYGKTKILNRVGQLIKILQKIARSDTDNARKRFDHKFIFNSYYKKKDFIGIIKPYFKKKVLKKIDTRAKHNLNPNSMFLSLLNSTPSKIFLQQDLVYKENSLKVDWDASIDPANDYTKILELNPSLGIGKEISIKPNQSIVLNFLFGYAQDEKIYGLIKKYEEITSNESILEWNAKEWKGTFCEINIEGLPWLSRETKWHSYYIRSAGFYDEYYEGHKYPQGSIYQFGHGFDGAIRDYALFMLSIIFINPLLAKEYLETILRLMQPDGKLPYGLHGYGKILSASVHSKPSDLYLFYIWAIFQYINYTQDYDFLEEKIPFYPKSSNKESTVLQRIEIALEYLFSDKVGFGEHGLIKSNDGDWSDGISLMVKKRKKFIKNGESSFNSTFALYLLNRLIPLLNEYKPKLKERTEVIYKKLKNAVINSFNGKWFYRGWDGMGNPIGDKNIYLEHHTWLLIAKILEKSQVEPLIKEIFETLDKPSKIGQYISYPPQKTTLGLLPKGWDVNGGIWHAINGLLTWGYSRCDMEKAINSITKNSLAKRAEVYPNIWYGIWSGPDAYIADYAENAGEAFYHLPTPMCDFPLMNLNVHACYLASIIKVLGVDAQYKTFNIDIKPELTNFSLKSSLLTFKMDNKSVFLCYRPIGRHPFTIKLKKPNWFDENSSIFLNDTEIRQNKENLIIKKDDISIKIIDSDEEITVNIIKR